MDIEKLNQDIETFLLAQPENSPFKSFDEPGDYFFKRELEYKRELAERFQELGKRLLAGNDDQFFEDLINLLSKQKLGSFNMVQNLVGFRDWGELKTIIEQSSEIRLGFTNQLCQLLDSVDDDESLWPRFDEFISWLRDNGLGVAGQTKIWPTLFLFLWRPNKFIFIKPNFFDQILALYGLEKLGKGIPLDSTQYRRVMRDMGKVKETIRRLGDTDFIGVQSFLWFVNRPPRNSSLPNFSNIWLIQSPHNVLANKAKLDFKWEVTGTDEQVSLYCAYIERFKSRDLIIFVDPQNRSKVLGEVSIDAVSLNDTTLSISATRLWIHPVSLSTELSEQFIVPGFVENHDFRDAESLDFCREYLDQARWNFLCSWNFEHISSIADTSKESSPTTNLSFVDGDIAKLLWNSKNGTVGDPIYFFHTTKYSPGIIAKARISDTNHIADYVLIEFEDAPTESATAFLSQARLEALLETHRWEPGQTLKSGKYDLRSNLRSLWNKAHRKSINLIYYGPPGTGKTHELSRMCLTEYTGATQTVSREEHLRKVLADMTWRAVIAVVLLQLGVPQSVTELIKHEYIRIKLSLSTANPSGILSLVWGYLQAHTPKHCTAVKQEHRLDPGWFWKNEDKTWKFVDDFDPSETGLNEYLSKLQAPLDDHSSQFKRYAFVTFHQSYSYEEFVEGIRPKLDVDTQQVAYELRHGIFREMCEKARKDPTGAPYAIFIDEINRGNISKIFGELITLIEEDKREDAQNELEVTLPYSKDTFRVPRNLDIYGTMNTADRSLVPIDNALRRRFTFKELMPDPSLLSTVLFKGTEIDLSRLLESMNERIEALFDREHTIGHAYFLSGNGVSISGAQLPTVFRAKIIPLLTEYFFDDWIKVREVLADDRAEKGLQFVHEHSVSSSSNKKVYRLNQTALDDPQAYIKIYS